MMSYTFGQPREQTTMLPETLEDFVSANSYLRVLDKAVGAIDVVKLGFKYAQTARTGRPPYDPGDLLRLYLYGYLHGINSCRDLAREAKINVELMWLIRRSTPDFRTIARFRKDNAEAIDAAMMKFNEFWTQLGLFGGELAAIDSSKFKAVNSKDRNYSEKKLKDLLERANRKAEEYKRILDNENLEESEEPPSLTVEKIRQLEEKLEELKRREREHSENLTKLRESGENQISLTDPESRRMKSGDGTIVGYSAQITVDSKHKMILDFQINNAGNDTQQLANMALRAKEILQIDTLKVAADTGYFKADDIVACEKSGIETYISAPRPPIKNKDVFQKKDFHYDAEKDLYICPANQELIFKGMVREHGRQLRRYEAQVTGTCTRCSLRQQCTSRKKGDRRLTRFSDEEILEKALTRAEQNPQIRTLRKSMVEHPFGTIKCRINHGRFRTKGIRGVTTEFALSVIAYNFKRAFSILGPKLLNSGPFTALSHYFHNTGVTGRKILRTNPLSALNESFLKIFALLNHRGFWHSLASATK
jgi:transposase